MSCVGMNPVGTRMNGLELQVWSLRDDLPRGAIALEFLGSVEHGVGARRLEQLLDNVLLVLAPDVNEPVAEFPERRLVRGSGIRGGAGPGRCSLGKPDLRRGRLGDDLAEAIARSLGQHLGAMTDRSNRALGQRV